MMRQTFLSLPLSQKAAALTAGFCFVACVVLILASHQGQRQLILLGSELFGESLVQQLARDTSSPLVQGDKLSLQALLNELIESPLVARGVIYDIENHPIAEAGELVDGHDVSASITFQDSIAGYAVVTYDTTLLQQRAAQQSWQLLGLALLLSALTFVVALYPGRQLSAVIRDLTLVARTPQKRRRSAHVAYHGEDELQDLAQAVLSGPLIQEQGRGPSDYAVLVIEITNLPSLQVNLGQQALANALRTLKQELVTLCRLYDGELKTSRSHCFTARFNASDDPSNYPFRALCSAFLIERSLSDSDLPFHLRLAVTSNHAALTKLEPDTGEQSTIEHGLLLSGMVSDGIVISDSVLQHSSVESRVLSTPLSDGANRALGLNDAYQQLLDGQLMTLREH